MRVVGKGKDLRNEHFFIRTGQKIIPLLKEVWDGYLKGRHGLKGIPSESACRRRLFPSDDWFEKFPKIADGNILPAQVDREVDRIRKKFEGFERHCGDAGLNLRQVYAAVEKWKRLFLEKDGEFYWFYQNLRLAYITGSFLFVHAGVDDVVAQILCDGGVNQLNRRFRRGLKQAPFDFYYGSLCNTVRTKYRDSRSPTHETRRAESAARRDHRHHPRAQELALWAAPLT